MLATVTVVLIDVICGYDVVVNHFDHQFSDAACILKAHSNPEKPARRNISMYKFPIKKFSINVVHSLID